MWILARALTYSTMYIGVLLVFLPVRVLAWSGVNAPPAAGLRQYCGMIITVFGAVLTLWCILTFVFRGKGTAAPFDPPRRLVSAGPYRFVRNPMYLGSGAALAGAALVYESYALLAYTGVYLLFMQLFVVLSEEPALRGTFGVEYETYCRQAGRWWPKW